MIGENQTGNYTQAEHGHFTEAMPCFFDIKGRERHVRIYPEEKRRRHDQI